MIRSTLDDLPFDTVKRLYMERIIVEATNDVKGRTCLLRDYPELFEADIWAEIEQVFGELLRLKRQPAVLCSRNDIPSHKK